jgi:hypothetical protein
MPDYPITLTVSPGRSGTVFLHATFVRNYPDNQAITHELIHAMVAQPAAFHRSFDPEIKKKILSLPILQDLLGRWRRQAKMGPVVDFGWTMSSLVPAFYDALGDQLRVLVLHRHPIAAAASFATMGFNRYLKHANYALTPRHARVRYPQYAGRWDQMSSFEKCLYRWLEVTAYGLELKSVLPELPCMVVAFEELVRSDSLLENIAEFLGFAKTDELVRGEETNSLENRCTEVSPIGREWRQYRDFPELLELAQQLGYNVEEANVQRLIAKYQLPPGVLPILRNVSGYWRLKSRVGNFMETLGLRKTNDGMLKLRRQMSGQI